MMLLPNILKIVYYRGKGDVYISSHPKPTLDDGGNVLQPEPTWVRIKAYFSPIRLVHIARENYGDVYQGHGIIYARKYDLDQNNFVAETSKFKFGGNIYSVLEVDYVFHNLIKVEVKREVSDREVDINV